MMAVHGAAVQRHGARPGQQAPQPRGAAGAPISLGDDDDDEALQRILAESALATEAAGAGAKGAAAQGAARGWRPCSNAVAGGVAASNHEMCSQPGCTRPHALPPSGPASTFIGPCWCCSLPSGPSHPHSTGHRGSAGAGSTRSRPITVRAARRWVGARPGHRRMPLPLEACTPLPFYPHSQSCSPPTSAAVHDTGAHACMHACMHGHARALMSHCILLHSCILAFLQPLCTPRLVRTTVAASERPPPSPPPTPNHPPG